MYQITLLACEFHFNTRLVYMDLSFSCAKVFHWGPLMQLRVKQAANRKKIDRAKVKHYFKCNLKQDRESTRDKVRLFQVLELQKRRHLPSTDSYTGREETRVLQDVPKESARDWPCKMLHRRVVSTEEMKTKKSSLAGEEGTNSGYVILTGCCCCKLQRHQEV